MTLVLFMLAVVAVVGQSSSVEATTTVPGVSRTLRAVVQYNNVLNSIHRPLYGGAGMTVTSTTTKGIYTITFPAGTWTNPKTATVCNFVPVVGMVSNPGGLPTYVQGYSENLDGSGTISTWDNSNNWSIIVVSADC